MISVLDTFSGIGAFSLGAANAGMRTEAFCEIEDFPAAVLAKHWPQVPNHRDITGFNASHFPQWSAVDILTGGFPCTDLSVSSFGSHQGLSGSESGLFFELARVAHQSSPRWIIIENVPSVIQYLNTITEHLYSWDFAYRV
jgi:DNA (cytosine-5)-methyltransferase 1